MEIMPIADIETPFSSKFGIPRQSGLVNSESKIVFRKEFRTPEAVRGLEDFSHIWLIWEFTKVPKKEFSPTVRPPRLGGNKRMGVFATRSPFRPNSLGLSCVELLKIDFEDLNAPVLYISGADILNGTPIYDIKPYLPHIDRIENARGGFSEKVKENEITVLFPEKIPQSISEKDIKIIQKILEEDPRPHYHENPDRIYAFEYSNYKIKFTCKEKTLQVLEITVI